MAEHNGETPQGECLDSGEMFDGIIIGGGIAGLSAALYAHRAGLKVLIFEPQPAPIDKACGEGLMPPAVKLLQELNVPIYGTAFKGITYVHPFGRTLANFSGHVGYGIRRWRLHESLQQEITRLNIPVIAAAVHTIAQYQDHVAVGSYRARYALLCDGLRSRLRKKLGFTVQRKLTPRFGIRQHFKVRSGTFQHVTVYWGKDFELYLTPISHDEVGVACLSRSPQQLLPTIRLFPELSHALGLPTSSVKGAGPFEHRVDKTYRNRVFLVGDAAGYLDPLTGEGLHLAIASAKLAVQCLAKNDPSHYHQQWLHLTKRYRVMTLSLLHLTLYGAGRWALYFGLKAVPEFLSMGIRFLLGDIKVSSEHQQQKTTPANVLVKGPHSL